LELDQADLTVAAAFSYAAYASPYPAWGALEALGLSTGPGGWIVNGSAQWASAYGAALGGTYQSSGGVQTSPGTDARGFYENNSATAIAAVKDGVLVVSFRGGGDSANDRVEGLTDPLSHYDRLRPFIDDVLQFVQDPSNGISEVIITGHSLGGEMAQLFTSSYTDGAAHAADVSALGLPPSQVSIITFGNPGLLNVAGANFTVSDVWASRIVNFLNTDDKAVDVFPRAGQDYLIDLNTVPATSVSPLPDVRPFSAKPLPLDPADHHPLNYKVAIDVLTSSPGFSWIDTNDITVFGIGDDHDNSSVCAPQGNPDQARFVLGLAGNDGLSGSNGNDVLDGGAGTDTLLGGAGSDTLNGGAGLDVASFFGAASGVTVDLSIGGAQNTGGAGIDQLVEIEYLTGSAYGDNLAGDGVHNVLLFGEAGNDWLQGGSGDDYLVGGAGFDVVSFANANAAVNVDLSVNGVQNTSGAGSDQLVEIEYLIGSAFDDNLAGDGVSNVLLSGGAGNDILHSGSGHDYLIGGAGYDVASFADALAGVNVDLSISGVQNTVGAGSDQLAEIEYLIGSAFGDKLQGDGVHNVLLSGGAGNDSLQGGVSDDYLLGGSGVDTLVGGAGADALVGGADADAFVFANISDIPSGSSLDTITDFNSSQSDKIDLGGIDANTTMSGNQSFSFIGLAAFGNVAGQLHYAANGSGGLIVEGDTNGNGIADFSLVIASLPSLTATDFVL
jgi:Ca2+-binding RTX toxin-like protein